MNWFAVRCDQISNASKAAAGFRSAAVGRSRNLVVEDRPRMCAPPSDRRAAFSLSGKR
jgi:hypothetical protein